MQVPFVRGTAWDAEYSKKIIPYSLTAKYLLMRVAFLRVNIKALQDLVDG